MRFDMLKWMLNNGFGPAMIHVNEDGVTAHALLERLIPRLEKMAKSVARAKAPIVISYWSFVISIEKMAKSVARAKAPIVISHCSLVICH